MSDKGKNKFILPCNGLDKSFGVMAGHVGIQLVEKDNTFKLICPVLFNSEFEKYQKQLQDGEVYVINGCMTRCASKLLESHKIPMKKQFFIPDMIKKHNIKPGTKLILDENSLILCDKIVEDIIESIKSDEFKNKNQIIEDNGPMIKDGFFLIQKDKFKFNVPKSGYYFNENDCWVKPEEDIAYVGISDFVQNNVGDIMFVELPKIGQKIGQFDDAGSFESVKTVTQLISPVSGEIIEINTKLNSNPELLNHDPYQKGWIAKIKMDNWLEDKELLMNCNDYFEYLKKKIEVEANKHN